MSRFCPIDEKELAEIVAASVASEEPLELISGGSKRNLGRPLQAPHTLDLSGFAGIKSYEAEELVLTAGAATKLTEIEEALAAKHQMLAFEPPDWRALLGSAEQAQTLGGIVACNLSGSRRIRQGAARDHFLGFSGVSGRGEVFKAGGRVVKNVTGYDLCKLMAGSYGTLTALTEITVKVLPAPEATRTVALHGLDDVGALRAMTLGLNSSHEVSGAAHLPQGAEPALTLLRLEGPKPSVEARATALRDELKAIGVGDILEEQRSDMVWRQVRDGARFTGDANRVLWRVSLPPSGAPALLAALRVKFDLDYLLDWGGGLVWLAIAGADDGAAATIRGALNGQGHATLIRAPAALRAVVPVFEPLAPAVAALTARVKDGFDPKRILNRGRLYPEL